MKKILFIFILFFSLFISCTNSDSYTRIVEFNGDYNISVYSYSFDSVTEPNDHPFISYDSFEIVDPTFYSKYNDLFSVTLKINDYKNIIYYNETMIYRFVFDINGKQYYVMLNECEMIDDAIYVTVKFYLSDIDIGIENRLFVYMIADIENDEENKLDYVLSTFEIQYEENKQNVDKIRKLPEWLFELIYEKNHKLVDK